MRVDWLASVSSKWPWLGVGARSSSILTLSLNQTNFSLSGAFGGFLSSCVFSLLQRPWSRLGHSVTTVAYSNVMRKAFAAWVTDRGSCVELSRRKRAAHSTVHFTMIWVHFHTHDPSHHRRCSDPLPLLLWALYYPILSFLLLLDADWHEVDLPQMLLSAEGKKHYRMSYRPVFLAIIIDELSDSLL